MPKRVSLIGVALRTAECRRSLATALRAASTPYRKRLVRDLGIRTGRLAPATALHGPARSLSGHSRRGGR